MLQNFYTQRVFKGTCAFKGYLRGTQRALEGHSKGTLKDLQGHFKGTRRTLGHSRRSSVWGTRTLEGHLGTQALRHPRHLGTWTLEHLIHLDTKGFWTLRHSRTWALGHSGSWALENIGTWTLEGHSKGTPKTFQGHFKGTQRALKVLDKHSKGTRALGYLGSLTLQMYLGTQALRYLDNRGTWGTLFGRHICWLGSQSCLFYFEHSFACLKDYQKSFILTFCATLL